LVGINHKMFYISRHKKLKFYYNLHFHRYCILQEEKIDNFIENQFHRKRQSEDYITEMLSHNTKTKKYHLQDAAPFYVIMLKLA
jgi:hypothetical protein